MKYLVAVLCLVACACATHFEDCGSQTSAVSSVQVDEDCILRANTSSTFTITFEKTKSNAFDITAFANIYLIEEDGKPSTLPIVSHVNFDEGCEEDGPDCRILLWNGLTYTLTFKLHPGDPLRDAVIQWVVLSDDARDMVPPYMLCVSVNCKAE